MKKNLVFLFIAMKKPVCAVNAGDAAQKRAGEVGKRMEPEPVEDDSGLPKKEEQKTDDEPRHL